MKTLTDYAVVKDASLRRKYANSRIPMATLYEAYFDGDIDLPEDSRLYDMLADRDLFVNYNITPGLLKWAATNMLPERLIHTQSQDTRIVREHYDRGNDFFEWFLGERMVYTSGFFESDDATVEEAQDCKFNLVCQKLQLEEGERLLDIGCGWGTLAAHAAMHYGADATGVTLAKEQTQFANARFEKWGLGDRARVLCKDYRDIPKQRFDKIVSLEMVEHVGVKNLDKYFKGVYDLLEDDGLFLLQWTGIRKLGIGPAYGPGDIGLRPEDLSWALFMNKYIFPGADASLACGPMTEYAERNGFEIQTIENVSFHYTLTLRRWHDNWMSNKEAIIATYGERWYRIWHFFLAWSALIGEQGRAACFQIVMNKNLDQYDRKKFITAPTPAFGSRRSDSLSQPALPSLKDDDVLPSVAAAE